MTRRVTIALPTADLRRAFRFHREGMGFSLARAAEGDEMPEPVELALNPDTLLMLVPTDGFRRVIGDNTVATGGVSECVVGLTAATDAEVDAIVARAERAGGSVVAAPARQPWGYSAAFKDPDGHVWLVVARP